MKLFCTSFANEVWFEYIQRRYITQNHRHNSFDDILLDPYTVCIHCTILFVNLFKTFVFIFKFMYLIL